MNPSTRVERLENMTFIEMRDRSEDMKNQLAGSRVRVDPFLQAEQGNTALLEHGDSREQLAE